MLRIKKAVLTLICCVFVYVPLAGADAIREASFEINSGVRQDRLTWDTSGVVEYYDSYIVSSQLDWDELDIYEIGGKGRLVVENGTMPFATCIRVRGAYGEIYDGEVRDSDYRSDADGTYEFSRSISESDDGDTLTLNAGIGPEFRFWDNRVSVAVLAGYNYHEQNLTLTNGLQVIGSSLMTPAVGTYMPDLNSSYDATWDGAWIGMDASVLLGKRLIIEAMLEVQDVNYEAEADWNLRTDLAHPVSFEHDADGVSIMTSLAVQYLFTESWALSGNLNYAYMLTEDGTHTAYGSDGSATRIRLNEVEWESIGATLGLRWIF